MENETPKEIAGDGKMSKIVTILISALFFIVPVMFLPWAWTDLVFTKWFIFSAVIIASAVLFLVRTLKSGHIVYYKEKIVLASLAVVLTTFLSAVFSPSFYRSFFGTGVESDTFMSIFFLMSAMLLVPVYLRRKDNIFYAYIALLGAFVVIGLFHISRLIFGADFLSFGLFVNQISNFIGRWNDLGVFFGLVAILSLINIEFLPLNKMFRVASYVALVVSLVMLAVVNFSVVWSILLVFGIVLFVYLFSFAKGIAADDENGENQVVVNKTSGRFHPATLALVIISLIFVIFGAKLGNSIAGALNIFQIEARPSWIATFHVAKETLAKDPIFGVGPGRFAEQWQKYKDPGVNASIFWSTDFRFGVGFIPTFAATGGMLSVLAWIVFLGLFVVLGLRALFQNTANLVSRYITISSFLASLFLFVVLLVYTPSLTVIMLAFLFAGLFLASCVENGVLKESSVAFGEDGKKNFIFVILISLLLAFYVFAGYLIVKKFTAGLYLNKGLYAAQALGDIDKAEKFMTRSASWSAGDWSYRALVDIQIVRINTMLNQFLNKAITEEEAKNQLQILLSRGLFDADKAINIDKGNYQNWLALGRLYASIVPTQTEGAYERARDAYLEAGKLNPLNPAIPLLLARLEGIKGDTKQAREYITQALSLKNNYTEAVFFLAQVEMADGNTKGAIDSLIAATYIAPNDFTLLFELGLLYYADKDYTNAATALERAVMLNPDYANAKYFLGLSYNRLDKDEEAAMLFEDLKRTNPENTDLDVMIKNVKAGRNALSGLSTQNPERQDAPPLQESD